MKGLVGSGQKPCLNGEGGCSNAVAVRGRMGLEIGRGRIAWVCLERGGKRESEERAQEAGGRSHATLEVFLSVLLGRPFNTLMVALMLETKRD